MDTSKYLELFISETREHIKLLNDNLLILEKKPDNNEAINQIFRSFHTIKGMAATMGYDPLANLAHRAEDILSEIRKGSISARASIINYLFSVVDYFEQALEILRSSNEILPNYDLLDKGAAILRGEAITEEVSSRSFYRVEEIKIKMARLDRLINLVNEFILARNRLKYIQSKLKDAELTQITDNLSFLIEELSDEVMMMRLLPLSTVFNIFPRWVRDEAQKLGKDVQFTVEGGNVEIDRSIIDDLKEPILHLLRNALDHGIEKEASGKTGFIKLVAHREKDFIKISVEDNGRGIDPEEIRRTAIKNNLIRKDEALKMSQSDILQIVFHPSFSTKEEVTGLSGRGVGLDVVKRAVEKMRGTIDIETAKGQGTKFIITIPIHLATIKVMVFTLAQEIYSLPLASIIETFNISEEDI
ncbi:MAG: ATP-binding protein, partial [candidate division WOR-3 bacterium]